MKRLFDITMSLVGLVALSPLFIIIALAIYATDGSPVFFSQIRVGLNAKQFRILKFRSMRQANFGDTSNFHAGDQTRVTPFGKFMRRTKLDELPQLFNVLRGDMSIVGPRPEVPEWTRLYGDKWKRVLSVRPGITDPASIAYRDEENALSQSNNPDLTYKNEILPRKLDLYQHYIDNWSFGRDLSIILTTFRAL